MRILLLLTILFTAAILFAAGETVNLADSLLYKYTQVQKRLTERLAKEKSKKGRAGVQRLMKLNQDAFDAARQNEAERLVKERKFLGSCQKQAKEDDKPRLEKMAAALDQREAALKKITEQMKPEKAPGKAKK